jgi:ElaB/YqjD/DUF883 family membrane-anchored ribosome-binding protein
MQRLIEDNSKEQLVHDFKVMMADTEALIRATANQGSEKVDELRAKTEESLKVVRLGILETQSNVIAKTKVAAKITDEYVHENPWKSIGVVASVSLLVGLLIGRR